MAKADSITPSRRATLFGAAALASVAVTGRSDRIEAEMMALPSTCAADVAAKMLVAHRDGEMSCLFFDDPVWVEARELTGGLA